MVTERRTRNQKFAGASLADCVVENEPGIAALTHLPLLALNIIISFGTTVERRWYLWVVRRRTSCVPQTVLYTTHRLKGLKLGYEHSRIRSYGLWHFNVSIFVYYPRTRLKNFGQAVIFRPRRTSVSSFLANSTVSSTNCRYRLRRSHYRNV